MGTLSAQLFDGSFGYGNGFLVGVFAFADVCALVAFFSGVCTDWGVMWPSLAVGYMISFLALPGFFIAMFIARYSARKRSVPRSSAGPPPPPPVHSAPGGCPSPQHRLGMPGIPAMPGMLVLPGMAAVPGAMQRPGLVMPGGVQRFMTTPQMPPHMLQPPSGNVPPPP